MAASPKFVLLVVILRLFMLTLSHQTPFDHRFHFGSDTVHRSQRTNLHWAATFIVNSYHFDTFIIYIHSKYYLFVYGNFLYTCLLFWNIKQIWVMKKDVLAGFCISQTPSYLRMSNIVHRPVPSAPSSLYRIQRVIQSLRMAECSCAKRSSWNVQTFLLTPVNAAVMR